jgi:serine/threonine protein kinase
MGQTKTYDYKVGDNIGGEYFVHHIFGGKGKSGMGVVYLVTSRKFDFPFILKTFQSISQSNQERFIKEVEAWIRLGYHPNIVKALGADIIDFQLFVAAEYVPFDDANKNRLTDFLYDGSLDIKTTLKWAVQFCYGMNYAFNNGLLAHRDIKPDNIMINPEGNLKITDFGLAKAENSNEYFSEESPNIKSKDYNYTQTNTFVGTIYYASPEQLLNAKSADHRSDIYSFGIILYQMVNLGNYPYKLPEASSKMVNEIVKAHLNEPIIKINSPFFPIIYKCLNKDPNKRYQSYNEMLYDFQLLSKNLSLHFPKDSFTGDSEIESLYIKARSYIALNDYNRALDYINQFFLRVKDNHSAYTLKGIILQNLKNDDEAINCFLKAIEIFPSDTSAHNNLGLLYKKKSDFNRAIYHLTQSISYDKINVGAMMNLGILYLEIHKYQESCSILLKALKLQPQKQVLIFNATNAVGLALRNNSPVNETIIELLKQLIKSDPNNATNLFNLGLVYYSKNIFPEALNYFIQVEKNKPNDAMLLIYIARSYGMIGRLNDAIIYCDKLIERNLERTKAILFKAQILAGQNKYEDALQLVKKELSSSEESEDLFYILAEIYEKKGDYNLAIDYLNLAKKILSKYPENKVKDKLQMINEKLNYIKSFINN